MTLNITERDKKLLIILAFFLIVVGGGAGILFPLMDTLQVTSQQLEEARLEQMERQQKVAMVPVLESKCEALEEALAENQKTFYELMPSKDIDKMLTGMAVGYGLYVQDLSIALPQSGTYASLQNYEAMLSQKLGLGESAAGLTSSYPGVFAASVSMVMNGTRPVLQSMVDECAGLEPKLRITGLSWQRSSGEEGGEEYTLSLNMEIYMYQNLQEYLSQASMAAASASQETNSAAQDVDDYLAE